MSEYLNACEAYLGTPSGKVSERRGASASPTPPNSRAKSAGGSSSTARRRRSAGVLVKAPSPVAEIPSTPLTKSARSRRRKKKIGEDISTSNSDSDYSVPVSCVCVFEFLGFIIKNEKNTISIIKEPDHIN